MSAESSTMPAGGRVATDAWRVRLSGLLARVGLPHLLVLALGLRLAVLSFATPAHPDEVFQYLETAHRMLFGQGVVTWEWRLGMRGWLLPVLVSGPMWLGAQIAPASGLYLFLPKLVATLASLAVVVVAWRMGERVSRLHAQVAGFVAATWFDMVYFAPHILSDTAGALLLLAGGWLLMDRTRWTFGRLAAGAALLAMAASIRFQDGPAIAALAVAACIPDLRRTWLPVLLGGAAGLVPSIVSDLAMGAVPFEWVIENVRLNLLEHKAEGFSSSGPLGYVQEVWPRIALWSAPLLVLAGVGARRYPALAWMAAINLVFHSMIAHKEYRFILPTMFALVLLAAIGSVDWVRHEERRKGAAAGRSRLRFVLIVWVAASVSCAAGGFRSQWLKFQPEMQLYAAERSDRQLCGLAVYQRHWSITGGYAYLHRATPLFYFDPYDRGRPATNLAASAAAFNTIMTRPSHAAELPASFVADACYGRNATQVCAYRRPGACAHTAADFELNAVLKRLGA